MNVTAGGLRQLNIKTLLQQDQAPPIIIIIIVVVVIIMKTKVHLAILELSQSDEALYAADY